MNPVFEQLARTRNRTFVGRTLFLWPQIMGQSCGAVPLLRQLSGIIIGLPLGADVMLHKIDIAACPEGFDVQARALPNADALFAYIPHAGLRLEMTAEMPPRPQELGRPGSILPVLRRLRVVDANGVLYRRRGGERFMLRYKLDLAVLQSKDLLFLQVAQEPGRQPGLLPPLRPWIEIDFGDASRIVETIETSAAMLVEGEAIRMSDFPVADLAVQAGEGEVQAVHLYIELTGDSVDVSLVGETLLS